MADTAPPAWWPDRNKSCFDTVGALRWHAQHWPCRSGSGCAPQALLLHGTGSGSFSWRHLAPLLAERFEVHAPDLPGHGWTQTPAHQSLSLPSVAAALDAWMKTRGIAPSLVVGHSAGAAIALRLVLDGMVSPALTVSINGAILPMQGPIGRLFLPIAKLLSTNPLVAPAFAAWASGPGAARRLLASTGSTLDAEGERCYAHLVADRTHAAGALRLMASWDLRPLEAELSRLSTPLLLIAALSDRTLPPSHALRVRDRLPLARLEQLPGLGHLAHEENAGAVGSAVLRAWVETRSASPVND